MVREPLSSLRAGRELLLLTHQCSFSTARPSRVRQLPTDCTPKAFLETPIRKRVASLSFKKGMRLRRGSPLGCYRNNNGLHSTRDKNRGNIGHKPSQVLNPGTDASRQQEEPELEERHPLEWERPAKNSGLMRPTDSTFQSFPV
jgi:hypothetical protein